MAKRSFIVCAAVALATLLSAGCCGNRNSNPGNLRLLYWNIQNGMWDGQEDGFNRFTGWVAAKNPDVCVWCEAQPIYKTASGDYLEDLEQWRQDAPLMDFWKKLAARYGHKYIFLSGHRDDYPQIISSRFPLESVDRITGNGADSTVSHGAGWARVKVAGKTINIVSLHTWPKRYGFNVPEEDWDRSKDAGEGDRFRRQEMEYICNHTILTSAHPEEEYWMMMGDFNARSRVDNWSYDLPEDSSRLLVHDYIRESTPYVDVIAERFPRSLISTTGSGHQRIDFVYVTRPLFDVMAEATVITDSYTDPVRDAQEIRNFWHPSDHRPILVDFDIR